MENRLFRGGGEAGSPVDSLRWGDDGGWTRVRVMELDRCWTNGYLYTSGVLGKRVTF